jgi:hypothetical protein
MMNSETSTSARVGANVSSGDRDRDALQPWQLFTLAGLAAATAVVFVAQNTTPAGMVILSLTVAFSGWLGLAAWRTLAPLFGINLSASTEVLGGRTRAALEREKVLVLRAIKDLEFDRAMGKVSDKDFADMSARLRARAAGLLRQLDRGAGYRDEIERELAKRVGAPAAVAGTGAGTAAGTKVPAYDSRVPRYESAAVGPNFSSGGERAAVGPNFSSGGVLAAGKSCACGAANDVDARFCKACGSRLEAA